MVIRYLSHWVRSFIFLIMDRLLRDNGVVVIMHDISFLIRGMQIMEIRRLSFYMSFLDHLHHSIIWQGGFDSGPGPMCSGIGRIPLWAELFYWVCASTPFIRRRFRPMSWACFLGLHMCYSLPPSVALQPLAEAGSGKG